jgi:hypothetical protein
MITFENRQSDELISIPGNPRINAQNIQLKKRIHPSFKKASL